MLGNSPCLAPSSSRHGCTWKKRPVAAAQGTRLQQAGECRHGAVSIPGHADDSNPTSRIVRQFVVDSQAAAYRKRDPAPEPLSRHMPKGIALSRTGHGLQSLDDPYLH